MKYWLPTINPDASLGGAPEGGKLVNTSSDKIEVISDNLVVNNNNPKVLLHTQCMGKGTVLQMF